MGSNVLMGLFLSLLLVCLSFVRTVKK